MFLRFQALLRKRKNGEKTGTSSLLQLEYTHFPNGLFAILLNSVMLTVIYFRHKCIASNLIILRTLHSKVMLLFVKYKPYITLTS